MHNDVRVNQKVVEKIETPERYRNFHEGIRKEPL